MVLTFEETPLFDWLKKNRFFLLGLAVVVFGVQGYKYYAPGLKYANQVEAWNLFQVISNDLALDLDTNLAPDLVQAQNYPTIYPWVVFRAANIALSNGNLGALATLKPKLQALAQGKDGADWKAFLESGEATTIAAVILSRVEDFESHGKTTWENPTPQGARVKFVVNSSSGDSYELVAGLYEDAAPAASTAFLEAVENGFLVGLEITAFGGALSFKGYHPEEEKNLPLERRPGLYHLAGALSTTSVPGEPGTQLADSVMVFLQDSFGYDGTTTVFGMLTEGLDQIQDALNTPAAGVTFSITEAVVL